MVVHTTRYRFAFLFINLLISCCFQSVFSNPFEKHSQNTLPEVPTNLTPANGASNVPTATNLTWSFGANTVEYQLLFGTNYPPTTPIVNWTNNLQTSYALSGLLSNTQYYWKLNVRNGEGTASGEIWSFTTALTVPVNLTVLVQDNAPEETMVSALLSWSASSRSLLGYNIYRNGQKINTQPYVATSYTNASLERNQTYTYYITAVYDEGESEPSNAVTVEVKGVGTFEGYVRDAFSEIPIQDALLTFQGANNTVTTQTNSEGFYTKKAYKDTYTTRVSKQAYITQTVAAAQLQHNATITKTIHLLEEPYAVQNVVAFETSNGYVNVSWETPEMPDPPSLQNWLTHCSGSNYGGVGAGETQTMAVASRWQPTALTPYIGKQLTKILFFPYSNEAFPTEANYTLCVWRGNNKNLIYSQPLETVNYNIWNEIELLNPISIVATEDLLFGYTVSYSGIAFPCGYDEGPANNNLGNLIQVGNNWYALTDVMPQMNYNWSLAAYITNERGETIAQLNNTSTHKPQATTISKNQLKQISGSPTEAKQLTSDAQKSLQSYNVWRVKQNGQSEFLCNTTSLTFADASWDTQTWGVYQWAVEAKYNENHLSQRILSNPIDKDINTTLQIRVALNSGELPYGIAVRLKNISEPLHNILFEGQIDSTEQMSFESIRKGTYELTLSKPGFFTRNETIELTKTSSLFFLMEEKILPPSGLFVAPTAKAKWIGKERFFEPCIQSFNQGAFTDGWKSVTGEAATVPVIWKVIDNYFNSLTNEYFNLNGSPFAIIDSEAAGEDEVVDSYLMSPIIDATMVSSLFLDFDQYLRVRSATTTCVEVYNGYEWVEVLNQNSNTGSWNFPNRQTIDLTPYINTNLKIRFHYHGAGEYFWAIDNINVYTTDNQKETRALNYYKVFLNNVFIADTPDEYYQYNTADLVEGQQYNTEVLSVFTTGFSEKSSYLWTYSPCENYDYPTAVTASQLYGTINIQVTWTNADLTHVNFLNIYRNNEYVARIFMEDAIDSWTDEYLPFGYYTYTLEYEYDDGAVNCENAACSNTVYLQAGGKITGTVTAMINNMPIEGATITATNAYASFETQSDAEGNYQLEVIDGIYTLTVKAPQFETFTVENVSVPYTATVIYNVQLYEYTYPPVNVTAELTADETVFVAWEQETAQQREFVNYKIYRSHVLTSEIVLLDSLTTTNFIDEQWDELPSGTYKWGVAACYELNQSEIVFSEKIDKDMLVAVELNVSTNNNDTPAQTRVRLTNTIEPDCNPIEIVLDETGTYSFETFRKGVYDINLFKPNYEPIALTDISIMNPTTLNYTMIEEILPVKMLYVGTTGYAKWKHPGSPPFSEQFEDFDFGIPEQWTIETANDLSDTWTYAESTAERFMRGTPYIIVDSDALGAGAVMDEKINTPKIDASACLQIQLSFYQHYKAASEDEFAQVEVFDGIEWVSVCYQTTTIGSWNNPVLTTIDLTPYANADFQVRFHYYSPSWNWYWAIDEIALTAIAPETTTVTSYKIWLDNTLIAETNQTYYQHQTESFVEGQTYLTEVQAVYATGESEKETFEWTYEPCTRFLGPIEIETQIAAINNVILNWERAVISKSLEKDQKNRSQQVFNQADFITHQGAGANGADLSALYGEAINFGAQANNNAGNKIADDFVLTENTYIEQIELYAYQTASSQTSTITGVYIELFDGDPSDGGQLVWGDPNENRLKSTNWTGVYRTTASDFMNTDRPIMKVVANINTILPEGNYWIAVSFSGTMQSGPLAIPRQILGEVNTGNALHYNNAVWNTWTDAGSNGQMGLPFIIRGIPEGEVSEKPFIGTNIYRDGMLIAELLQNEQYVDRYVDFGNHSYCIALVYEDYAMSCFETNCIDVQLDFPCWKPYNLDAEYTFIENQIGVKLSWQWQAEAKTETPPHGYQLKAFNIYRKSGGETFELLTQMTVDEQTLNHEYVDFELTIQTAYYYQVKAVYEYTGGICESNAAPALNNPDQDFVIVIVTDINETKETVPKIYPNPTTGTLRIANCELGTDEKIIVYDIHGTQLFETKNLNIDISNYPAGMYILNVNGKYLKAIKEK